MPSVDREGSRDRELVLKHQHSVSDSGRASVPMYAFSTTICAFATRLHSILGIFPCYPRISCLFDETNMSTWEMQVGQL